MHTHMQTRTRTRTHARTHVHADTHTYMCAHTYVHIQMHTHTQIWHLVVFQKKIHALDGHLGIRVNVMTARNHSAISNLSIIRIFHMFLYHVFLTAILPIPLYFQFLIHFCERRLTTTHGLQAKLVVDWRISRCYIPQFFSCLAVIPTVKGQIFFLIWRFVYIIFGCPPRHEHVKPDDNCSLFSELGLLSGETIPWGIHVRDE